MTLRLPNRVRRTEGLLSQSAQRGKLRETGFFAAGLEFTMKYVSSLYRYA